MMKTAVRILVALVAAASVHAQSIEGTYQCNGAAPGGGAAYSGEVSVKKAGGHYLVNWLLGSAGSYSGSGLVSGNVFAVAYGGGTPYGLVVYKVSGGKLSGSWLVGGAGNVVTGEEFLEGPEGLAGKYKINSGKSSKGTSYSGEVAINKTGETYSVNWTLPNESYSGVGILQGDLLVVAWGSGKGYGVVAYEISDGKLEGKWAAAGSESLGTETLAK